MFVFSPMEQCRPPPPLPPPPTRQEIMDFIPAKLEIFLVKVWQFWY